MPCYYPLTAFQTESGDIVFAERGKIRRELRLACGQCVGCRLERSRQWAVRCMHESAMHNANCFVTLTYDERNVPRDMSLCYMDFQKFLKRLRRSLDEKKMRFYMCGEYGEKFKRPHYHACLFGYRPVDLTYWRKSEAGFDLFRSESLEKIWGLGSVEIGDVSFESAGYIARYIMKKVTGDNAEKHYEMVDGDTGEVYSRRAEFTRMSLKPGIGRSWYDKYKDEVFPLDRVVVRGIECPVPRYYFRLLKSSGSFAIDDVEYNRYKKGIKSLADNTPERLRVKEEVCKARIKTLKRSVE